MGDTFSCGCRRSFMGTWTLCDEHETDLISNLSYEREEEGGK